MGLAGWGACEAPGHRLPVGGQGMAGWIPQRQQNIGIESLVSEPAARP